MKNLFLIVLFVFPLVVFSQIDTLNPLTQKQISDSVFSALDGYLPTGKLYNRLMLEDTNQSICWNSHLIGTVEAEEKSNADYVFGVLQELREMSVDTSSIPSLITVFDSVRSFVAEAEFELDSYYYPVAIIDYDYNYINVANNIQDGNITVVNEVINIASSPVIENKKVQIVGPLFDLHESDEMALIFKPEYFYSNRKEISDIISLLIEFNNQTFALNWNELFYFEPNLDTVQQFKVIVNYGDSSNIEKEFIIHTPEIELIKFKSNSFPGCDDEMRVNKGGNKLKACIIARCGANETNFRLFKPYILLTGYRPPVIGQSFKKTWKIYNDQHASLLNSLRDNNYDIILVKFNIHVKPYTHGLQQSAELLQEFLENVNTAKGGQLSGQENIIQANSMSADIARLTLLRMEKQHLEDNNYAHHHTRLYMPYDANFYGANLPLAYQFQVYSFFKYRLMYIPPPASIPKLFMSTFLYATLQQRTVKELLMYHATAPSDNIFDAPYYHITYTANHHWRRQEFYNKLQEVDNGVHIFPMPLSPRNISISLGKIRGTNNVENNGEANESYPSPGQYWRNVNLGLWTFRVRAAKFMPGNQNTELFWRKKIGLSWNSLYVNHRVHINQMQELDNASGSFLEGTGNLISVCNWTYFTLLNIFDGKDYFSHKSVITALGINKNLWPANGSHTLDMQALGLMNINKQLNGVLVPSNHYGYPNLGRPIDHFQVTPFEAIYVDNKLNPHIKLKDDLPEDLAALNDFILNEVEPWYLGLQNKSIGANARSNYEYHSYRRAKHLIVVGNLVTPSTDPGDFTVEQNGKLTLKAGDQINLKPGTHFKAGSNVHIVPEYQVCYDLKSGTTNNEGGQNALHESLHLERINTALSAEQEPHFTLYPNPGTDFVAIKSKNTVVKLVQFFDINGQLKKEVRMVEDGRIEISDLRTGVYLVKAQGENHTETLKFIKL
jgi:hypothetical protein